MKGNTIVRTLLNTLYIVSKDNYLGREGQTVVIRNDKEKLAQFPIHNFEDIVCFNYTGASPSLVELCSEFNVNITYLKPNGKFIGKYYSRKKGNVLLRREQFRIAEDSNRSLEYARLFIYGKGYNSIKVIDRGMRDHSSQMNLEDLSNIKKHLANSIEMIKKIDSFESLLGVEGEMSREYFKGINNLIVSQKESFVFNGRNRRPPQDPINAMLSLSYGLIRTKVESSLESVGLDPYVGFYHRDRPGRASLALDVMEELRNYMGDRFVLSLINRQQIKKEDFITKENGAVLFNDKGFNKFLDLWNRRMQEELKHPFLEETINIGLLPYTQAQLLARTIRGDLEMYPPFFQN